MIKGTTVTHDLLLQKSQRATLLEQQAHAT
jgi:hypothetical protein